MSIRKRTGKIVGAVAGQKNLRRMRRTEARVRGRLAEWIAMPAGDKPMGGASTGQPAGKSTRGSRQTSDTPPTAKSPLAQSTLGPSDAFVPHPKPPMSRHQFLAGLHERLRPRTYLEIGIRDGQSLALAHCKAIGVDPEFRIVREVRADLSLFRLSSDDFFARKDAFAHFDGTPLDLAFIDGMHLSEFAFRDFINVEKVMSAGGVVVFDDILPRNPQEAARERQTVYWAGDVYKAVEVLRRRRPDLLVLLVNTAPTGTAIVARLDPKSTQNTAIYRSELSTFTAPDPQAPPPDFMDRSTAVDPRRILDLEVWDRLVAGREDPTELSAVWDGLASLRDG